MKTARVHLKSISPYSQSRQHEEPKLEREGADDYEKRTWKSKAHVGSDGFVYIPGMAFKNCLAEAAKYMSIQVPGKGKSTYTKSFEAGVLVFDHLVLPVHIDDIDSITLHQNSDGVRGSGKRVKRTFPIVPEWSGVVTFHVADEQITEAVFRKHIEAAGQFIGIGRWRPRQGGANGRFNVTKLEWIND